MNKSSRNGILSMATGVPLLLQIDLLGKLLTEFPIASLAGIVVGNEAISRRDVSQEQLIEAIAQVGFDHDGFRGLQEQ